MFENGLGFVSREIRPHAHMIDDRSSSPRTHLGYFRVAPSAVGFVRLVRRETFRQFPVLNRRWSTLGFSWLRRIVRTGADERQRYEKSEKACCWQHLPYLFHLSPPNGNANR